MNPISVDKRIEIKFVLDHEDYIVRFLKWRYYTRPELQEIYHQRIVHNIYFDTSAHSSYKENLLGHAHKQKIRARWYDKSGLNAHLEVKRKIDDVTLKDVYAPGKLSELLKNGVTLQGEKFHPALYNEYERKYFSFFGKIRVTLDKNIKYTSQIKNISKAALVSEGPVYVLEIKYDRALDQDYLDLFFRDFPFTRSKFSKYYSGYCNAYN